MNFLEDDPSGLACPDCPLCGHPPVFILRGCVQAFCGNDDCEAIAWPGTEYGHRMAAEESAGGPVPRSQEYYWTRRWQEGERESLQAQANGDAVTFDGNDPTDIVHWLLS